MEKLTKFLNGHDSFSIALDFYSFRGLKRFPGGPVFDIVTANRLKGGLFAYYSIIADRTHVLEVVKELPGIYDVNLLCRLQNPGYVVLGMSECDKPDLALVDSSPYHTGFVGKLLDTLVEDPYPKWKPAGRERQYGVSLIYQMVKDGNGLMLSAAIGFSGKELGVVGYPEHGELIGKWRDRIAVAASVGELNAEKFVAHWVQNSNGITESLSDILYVSAVSAEDAAEKALIKYNVYRDMTIEV